MHKMALFVDFHNLLLFTLHLNTKQMNKRLIIIWFRSAEKWQIVVRSLQVYLEGDIRLYRIHSGGWLINAIFVAVL